MKKQILLISMMLTIVGVMAQGVNFHVRKDLKKNYYKVVIDNITAGTAPFDITFNGTMYLWILCSLSMVLITS